MLQLQLQLHLHLCIAHLSSYHFIYIHSTYPSDNTPFTYPVNLEYRPAEMSNPIPISSVPIPIPQSQGQSHASSSATRASSIGRSHSTRRASHSQGASGLGRRPSRVTHPPPVPTRALSHDEALDALRGFLKERSSYDVFPVSFRLIVLDTTLKVKKALDVMLLYSTFWLMRLNMS